VDASGESSGGRSSGFRSLLYPVTIRGLTQKRKLVLKMPLISDGERLQYGSFRYDFFDRDSKTTRMILAATPDVKAQTSGVESLRRNKVLA